MGSLYENMRVEILIADELVLAHGGSTLNMHMVQVLLRARNEVSTNSKRS